ncbi:MAG: hypothetical protein GXO16_04665 [Epsilonproteobacteria bacterium]|nr:hypothetical protein [Campylobacterota bacterium]
MLFVGEYLYFGAKLVAVDEKLLNPFDGYIFELCLKLTIFVILKDDPLFYRKYLVIFLV